MGNCCSDDGLEFEDDTCCDIVCMTREHKDARARAFMMSVESEQSRKQSQKGSCPPRGISIIDLRRKCPGCNLETKAYTGFPSGVSICTGCHHKFT